MANISFNLNELYTKVFGYRGTILDYDITDSSASLTAKATGFLGMPIFERVTVKYKYNDKDEDYTFPDWPLIDITASKTIVTTAISGRNGTVKEHISIDDYQIGIRGILINKDSDAYPELMVQNLHNIFKVDTELQVTSPVLNLLDIHNLVIKDIKFPEVEGYSNMQPYVLQCLSDMPLELVIKDAKNQTLK